MKRLLPPRKKDWKKGVPQIGVALRTPDGSYIEMVHDSASPEEVAFITCLIRGLRSSTVDPKVVQVVYDFVKKTTPDPKNPKGKNGVER